MTPAPEDSKDCAHFWVIETPQGPTSTGRCKYCGMVREFQNVWTDSFNEHQVATVSTESPSEQEKAYA